MLYYLGLVLLQLILCNQKIPLTYNESEGYYYLSIQIGTPQKSLTLILDTSSVYTYIIPDTDNDDSNNYNPLQSQTYKETQCQFPIQFCKQNSSEFENQDYYGFTQRGKVGEDIFLLNQKNKKFLKFGMYLERPPTLQGLSINGILGLGASKDLNFLYQMHSQYTICLGTMDKYIELQPQQLNKNHVLKYDNSSSRFNLKLSKAEVNVAGNISQILNDTNNYEITLDSGSSLVFTNPEIADQFKNSFKCIHYECPTIYEIDGLSCVYLYFYHRSFEFYAQMFPVYRFFFQNSTKFDWIPQHYLTKMKENLYCLPVMEYTFMKPTIVLGQVWMKNSKMTFDLDEQLVYIENDDCQFRDIYQSNDLWLVLGITIAFGVVFFFAMFIYLKYKRVQLIKKLEINSNIQDPKYVELERYIQKNTS